MDPLTHGLLGAAVAGTLWQRRLGRVTFPIGMLAAMAPDLDVLIHSPTDHLLGMIYHRQFTHALAFIPIGAAITVLPFLGSRLLRCYRAWTAYLAALAGYATHALLDGLTSYGTMWYWPFSHARVSLDTIAIIDPLVTLPLLVGVLMGWVGRPRWSLRKEPGMAGPRRWPVAAGLALALLYLGLGAVQHERGMRYQAQLAQERGQLSERGRVMPTLANVIVWRSLYEAGGRMYADALRVPLWGPITVTPGSSLPLFMDDADWDFRRRAGAQALHQIDVLRWFTDGWLARVPDQPQVVGDMRYSQTTGGFVPLWGLWLKPDGMDGIRGTMIHLPAQAGDSLQKLMDEISGRQRDATRLPKPGAPYQE